MICIEKGDSDELLKPSVTDSVIGSVVPRSPSVGAPDSIPVAVSKFAQAGWLSTLNVSLSLSGSEEFGEKEYACPMTAELPGLPEMVGVPLLLGGGSAGVTVVPSSFESSKQPVNDIAATRALSRSLAFNPLIVIS
jgi:hypothetical protein